MQTENTPQWKKDYLVLRANPERWAKHKETARRRRKVRYNTDPEYRAAWKARNAARQKEVTRDPLRWAKRIIIRLRHKCKNGDIPFSITAADIHIPAVCPVFGTPFVFGGTNGYKDWNSPSIDRVIPELGYVPGNICVISARANTIKNNATADELRRIVAYIDANS